MGSDSASMPPPASHTVSAEQSEANLDDTTMTEIDVDGDHSDAKSQSNSNDGSGDEGSTKKNVKYVKDQNRPKRKKARRACYACQRAHLTCGDERPCLRCVKRGLAEHCQDGVRKKAKYLQDVPQEELNSGALSAVKAAIPSQNRRRTNSGVSPLEQTGPYFPAQPPAGDFTRMQPDLARAQQSQDDATMSDNIDPSIRGSFSAESQRMNSMPAPPPPQQDQSQGNQQHLGSIPFDPSDPAFFNFDLSSMDFGSRFGAMEFGMLHHMSANAFESPDDSSLLNIGSNGQLNYDQPGAFAASTPGFGYGPGANSFSTWPNNQATLARQGSTGHVFGIQGNETYPGAFAIGEGGPGSISSASPGNTGVDMNAYASSPVATSSSYPHRRSQAEFPASTTATSNPFANTAGPRHADADRRRRRDPSVIYQSVTEPYSYTTGFHLLTAFVARRFSKDKVLRIAKALASIRPSFISCTRELSRDDLIFMEKGFQRNLLLYDDFINAYGCPTLICRRTGEIAAVSKEFSMLTGWRRDVLLGKEANLNVNFGGSSGDNTTGTGTGNSTRGAATPIKPVNGETAASVAVESGRPQPVFLAELLDDDTAVQFYDDFAKMAFSDARGHVARRGKLLKYKTKDDPGWTTGVTEGSGANAEDPAAGPPKHNGDSKASAVGKFGSGIDVLGEKDGKVDVMICHCVKRDTFDIPMMVIMNFLPIIP